MKKWFRRQAYLIVPIVGFVIVMFSAPFSTSDRFVIWENHAVEVALLIVGLTLIVGSFLLVGWGVDEG